MSKAKSFRFFLCLIDKLAQKSRLWETLKTFLMNILVI